MVQQPAAVRNRQQSPTCDVDGKMLISTRTASKRRRETFQAALRIHGGTSTNAIPAVIGLIDTLSVNVSLKKLITAFRAKTKVLHKVFPAIYNQRVQEFEVSDENVLRSISTYFNKGVTGKRKYRSTYRTLSMKTCYKNERKQQERLAIMSCKVARLLPYHKLISHVKSIDIGTIYSVREDFCSDLDEEEKVKGCYRHLTQFLPLLASFYFKLAEQASAGEELLWFDGKVNTFHIVLGGDGAPFGKDDTACSWLVSFLNRGKHILSSCENFLVFGANCGESSIVIQRYVKFLFSEISEIKKTSFVVNGKEIKFEFSEFPNDLKMMAFLAGELSLSATYFSTFANVSTKDCCEVDGTFGPKPKDKWRPWKYAERVSVANEVSKLKLKVEKQACAAATKRNKITSFISGKGSRQEFPPLIGQFVDNAHIDPLHVKNNACQQVFRSILYESIGKSALQNTIHRFEDVPKTAPFSKLVNCLLKQANLQRLANKVKRWFNDTNGSGKDFQYRFTGKDSRMFLHHFMSIIDSLSLPSDCNKQTFFLHVFVYICLQLRQCVSLFSRVINISKQDLKDLKQHCSNFFRACCLFTPTITPTVWNIGHIIPAHAQDVYNKYKLGLNVVSMEGRESKHVAIARYSSNTNYSGRWEQIFRHEFIQLVYLRERGYYDSENLTYKQTYVPSHVTEGKSCFCGFRLGSDQGKCSYCSHAYQADIQESVQKGKLCVSKRLLK